MANAANRKKMKVKVEDAMKPFVVLFIMNTAILATWTKLDPLKWVRIETRTDVFGRTVESYGICDSENIVPYVVSIFVVNFSFLMLANYQVYRSRNFSTEFSESKYISIIMASFFQAIVIGLPLSLIVSTLPVARFIVLTCIIGAMCLSSLGFTFAPKVMAVKRKRAEERAPVDVYEVRDEPEANQDEVQADNIIEIKADLDDDEADDKAVEEASGMLASVWNGANEIYRRASIAASYPEYNDEEGGDREGVMRGKSICVGTINNYDSGYDSSTH